MKFLLIFIVLGLTGSAIAGGNSNCGSLQANYLAILNACEYLLNETASFVNNTVHFYPYVGNSYIGTLLCSLNINIETVAFGASHFSGVQSGYILGIFNGTVHPPFISPLDCIEAELMSFYFYIQNVTEYVDEMRSHITSSPINETTPCSTVVQLQSQYFTNAENFKTIGLRAATAVASAFASVGLSILYINQISKVQVCSQFEMINIIQEFYNMNSTIANEFVANQSINVPRPLSCVQNMMTSYISGVNSTYDIINNNINSTNNAPSSCEPFFSDFKAFRDTWIKYIIQLRLNAISVSIENPVLTPFFVADLLCEVDIMIIFAANATSYLSGVDSDVILGILNGDVPNPLPSPLDCVVNDLNFMRSQISYLINNVIPGFENFAINSTSDTSTCNTTYTALTGYVVKLVDLLNMKGSFVTSGTALYTSTNLSDLFMESFTSILDCLPDLVGKYVGAALNTNGSAVTAYVNGDRRSLPYPFNCARILIDITDSLMNQALINFVTESPNNLVLPNIPRFRG